MKDHFTILIADRNPHVRDFLKRELVSEGYRVRLAENGRQLLQYAFEQDPLDLIILDPDLADTDEIALLKKLQDRIPALPLVIHTFLSNYQPSLPLFPEAVLVEKGARSAERLKEIVGRILVRSGSPRREQGR